MIQSKLVVHDNLPSEAKIAQALKVEKVLCFYDQYLLNFPKIRDWIAGFEYGFSVVGGEDLKDLKNFPGLVEKILPETQGFGPKNLGLVVIGGGSVGDAGAFLASVLKRGIPYFNLPSTWLAALDSAHGGKTGLNVGIHKNQIGSFYPAKQIWISKTLLSTQDDQQRSSAFGELAKMSLLVGGKLFERLCSAPAIDDPLIWKLLPDAVAAKNKIVRQDPYEENGKRYALNLGHTLGHALELHHRMPHGEAVRLGLWFMNEWSFQRKYLKRNFYVQIQHLLNTPPAEAHQLRKHEINQALRHDKKITAENKIRFVFLEKPGKPRIELVSIEDILAECERQLWLKK